MPMNKYGADSVNLIINGIVLEEFGDTDPPIRVSDVEDRATLKRGIGGTSLRLDNVTRPKQLDVYLMPGSEEVRQLIALEKSGADIGFTLTVQGTQERVVGFSGIIQTRGDLERAGKTSISDEQFTIVCADSEET